MDNSACKCSHIFLPFAVSCKDKDPNPVNVKLSAICTNSPIPTAN